MPAPAPTATSQPQSPSEPDSSSAVAPVRVASPVEQPDYAPAALPLPPLEAGADEVALWAIDVGISRNAARLLERAAIDSQALRKVDLSDLNDIGLSASLAKHVLFARESAPARELIEC